MEIEVELDPDVVERLARYRREHNLTFDEAVNEVLQRGIEVLEEQMHDLSSGSSPAER